MGVSASQLDSFVQGQPKKLYSASVVGLANIDLNNFPTDAKVLIFQFSNMQVANNGKVFTLRVSTDNGLSYDNGGSAYSYAKRYVFTASNGYLVNAGVNTIRIDSSSLGAGTNRKMHFTVMVFDPFNAKFTKILAHTSGIDQSDRGTLGFGGHCHETATIVSGLRFYVSGTTFTDGDYVAYAI
jgi:hypothetical protein